MHSSVRGQRPGTNTTRIQPRPLYVRRVLHLNTVSQHLPSVFSRLTVAVGACMGQEGEAEEQPPGPRTRGKHRAETAGGFPTFARPLAHTVGWVTTVCVF